MLAISALAQSDQYPSVQFNNLYVHGICTGCVSTPVHNTAIGFNFSGLVADNAIRRSVAVYDVTIPADYLAGTVPTTTDSAASAKVAATGNTVFQIFLDDTTAEGTITFSAGQKVGVFSANPQFSLLAKHSISVVAPAIHDTTLSEVSVTFSGAR